MSEALQSTRSPVALLTMVHGALEPILMDYVDRLDPPMAGIVRYHFGWLDDTQPQSGARHRLVPLLYLSAEAAGGAGEHWVAPAVAYTLMGNCALMLDDILDDDRLRRGHPTVWARYGVPFAAQTSASLLGLAYEVLAEQRGPMMAEAARRMSVVVRAGGAAQLRDVELERRVDVTLDEALAVTA
ncbi:MAG TPA: polyprenyl synthetase family protein, partial [Pilimelia sp.]|nr:polyprenyl synthetase family protein [Pilimelia sp.]